MNLLRKYLKEVDKFADENIKVVIFGDSSKLDSDLQDKIYQVQKKSLNNTDFTLNIALNYGGREEITNAVKLISKDVSDGVISQEQISEELFASYLYSKNQRDPDLIIRPSGEHRLSNFLLWQSAYSEFVYMNVLWPDFSDKDIDFAIGEYNKRERRFGGV